MKDNNSNHNNNHKRTFGAPSVGVKNSDALPGEINNKMVDVFLVISIIVAFFILAVVALYLLVYYQHPDDRNEAYIPKLVVLGGFVLAGATALLLPLDVANREGYAGT